MVAVLVCGSSTLRSACGTTFNTFSACAAAGNNRAASSTASLIEVFAINPSVSRPGPLQARCRQLVIVAPRPAMNRINLPIVESTKQEHHLQGVNPRRVPNCRVPRISLRRVINTLNRAPKFPAHAQEIPAAAQRNDDLSTTCRNFFPYSREFRRPPFDGEGRSMG